MSLQMLYLLPADGFGGAERQGAYHVAELPRHGVDVTVFAGPSAPMTAALRDAHVAHEPFPPGLDALSAPRYGVRHVARWLAALARSWREIERRVRGRHFDVIFANRTVAWLVAAVLAKKLRVPYVIRAGSRPAHPVLPYALGLLDRVARPAAAFYNCLAVERALAPHLHCPSYILANAVDVTRFTPAAGAGRRAARVRFGLPEQGPLVGLAARPAPEKGFDLFADVVARVHARSPEVGFIVAGEFAFRARYEASLRDAGLAETVRFLGHVDAIEDFYRAVDVVILTSRERSIEASPNALLEAMATGRPVVATAVGGVPELVTSGRDGYLAREDDASCFAARLLALLDAPSCRDRLGKNGRKRAEARHGVPTVVEELAQRVRSVVSRADAARRGVPL